LLLFLLSSVLLLVNSHQEMHIKLSKSSISCDNKTRQLKRRLWQTVYQLKAILRLLAGCRYVSQHSVRRTLHLSFTSSSPLQPDRFQSIISQSVIFKWPV